MKKPNQSRSPLRLVAAGIVFVAVLIAGGYLVTKGTNIDVLNSRGIIADKEKKLILFTTTLGMLVIIPVFVMLFTIAWKYRDTNDSTNKKYRPDHAGNRLVETIWWAIPIIIISLLGVITWMSTHDLDPYKKLSSHTHPIRVQVVALQWRWLFIYPDQKIASINEVRFPKDTPVNFQLTSDAPMSAFWIPSLGSQIYAMNGMTTQLSLQAHDVGNYRGSNTNISGKGYSKMNFVAKSMTNTDFKAWVTKTQHQTVVLDQTSYAALAQPSEDVSVKYYRLGQKDLFDSILAKYMSQGTMDMTSNTATNMSSNEGMSH